jgi:hypothetical protein
MAPLKLWLEMEIGITAGEEDRVDNTGVDNASLYTKPEDIWEVSTRECQVETRVVGDTSGVCEGDGGGG